MEKKKRIALAALATLVALGSLVTIEEATREDIYYTIKTTDIIKIDPAISYMLDGSVIYYLPKGILVGDEGYITTDKYVLKSKKGPGIITRTISELNENISKLVRKK